MSSGTVATTFERPIGMTDSVRSSRLAVTAYSPDSGSGARSANWLEPAGEEGVGEAAGGAGAAGSEVGGPARAGAGADAEGDRLQAVMKVTASAASSAGRRHRGGGGSRGAPPGTGRVFSPSPPLPAQPGTSLRSRN